MTGYALFVVGIALAGIGVSALIPPREWVPAKDRRLRHSETLTGIVYVFAALCIVFTAGGMLAGGR